MKQQNVMKTKPKNLSLFIEIVNILMILISLCITRILVVDIRFSSSIPQTRKFDEQTKRYQTCEATSVDDFSNFENPYIQATEKCSLTIAPFLRNPRDNT